MRPGERQAVRCECLERQIGEKYARAIQLPPAFLHATLKSFVLDGRGDSIAAAHRAAMGYVREWLPGPQAGGLLFHGPVGTGKTHLSVAILRNLVQLKGASCLFVDFRDLLKRVQASYGGDGPSEAKLLAPVWEADVVVLDELGAMRSTEWVSDTLERIVGERYNRALSTIITTNYPMRGPATLHSVDSARGYGRAASEATRAETLGDRVGARMFSRLQGMCRAVPVEGTDYRATQGFRQAL